MENWGDPRGGDDLYCQSEKLSSISHIIMGTLCTFAISRSMLGLRNEVKRTNCEGGNPPQTFKRDIAVYKTGRICPQLQELSKFDPVQPS